MTGTCCRSASSFGRRIWCRTRSSPAAGARDLQSHRDPGRDEEGISPERLAPDTTTWMRRRRATRLVARSRSSNLHKGQTMSSATSTVAGRRFMLGVPVAPRGHMKVRGDRADSKRLLSCGLWLAVLLCPRFLPPAADSKPNILVIWGDDIGRDNISAYSLGIMGYQTPNIDRIAKEGALFTDSYAQQSCTAGRASFILGRASVPHRLADHRHAGFAARHSRLGPDDRRPAEATRLCHRPVRQEPPGRPRLAPADGARLRRILRQSLSPECGRRTGNLLLSEGSGVQKEVWPARSDPFMVRRQGRAARSKIPAR